MPLRLHFTIFLVISLALHALVIAALFLIKPTHPEMPLITPVTIVNLPQQKINQLPPLDRPTPVPPSPPAPVPERFKPEKPLPPSAVPLPKKFGTSEEVKLPKTVPRTGVPEGAERGKKTGKTGSKPHKETGPLPFLTQNDIDELARKGMPKKRPGDDSVTLDTDEFKFMSYNRWLKVKVESVLQYPELAAISGYQGTLYLLFDIMKDGSLGRLEILKSSGYKILDDEALRSIRDSAPYQPLPDEWNLERYSIRAAVLFYLGAGYIR
ncbi:MAG: energy transducer TonB [Nitrospirae bacterium]|nr:energy transducer TonB [Nitrospirota bacterium]